MKNLMHRIALALAACAAALALNACTEEGTEPKPEPGTLTTQTEQLSFRSGTSSQLIDVKAVETGELVVEVTYEGTAADWITTAVQADGVLVTVAKNPAEARTAKVIINAENAAQALSVPVSQKEVFESELIGKFSPKLDEENSTDEFPYGDLFINYEWTDPANSPTLDLSFMDPTATEPIALPLDFIIPIAQQMVQQLYYRGLTFFEFKDDGTIGAGYCEMIDFLNLEFSEEKLFPNPETLAVLPADAITYFTQEGKVYFAIDKKFLSAVGTAELEMDLLPIIDEILAQYPDLGIISNDEVYALPLKYTLEGDVLTILVDKEMMMPYKELITGLAGMIPKEIPLQMDPEADPIIVPAQALVNSLLTAVFDQTKVFEFGIRLVKKA